MNWFLNLFNRSIKVGSRVQTEFGIGTVTGGTIQVKYDEGNFPQNVRRHPNEKSWTHNLNNVTLR